MREARVVSSAYLLTLWTYGDRPLFADAEAARLFCRILTRLRRRLAFRLIAFVVLPDRARLIIATPDGDVRSAQVVAQRLKSRFAREWNVRRDRLGLVWQDADQMASLDGPEQIARRASLLHQSPVLAGLARDPADWRWSSVRSWEGTGSAPAVVDRPPAAHARAAQVVSG
jgi:REP-associated tyrosine transposase